MEEKKGILIEGKSLKEIAFCALIGAGGWAVLGVLQSLIWQSITQTHGYYYGVLPGVIIGLLIGIITGIYGINAGVLAGAIIGVLGNFFCVATLAKPLPIDIKVFWGEIRAPIYVAIPGGILGAISSMIIEKLRSSYVFHH